MSKSKVTLTEIAERITEHLRRFEADPKVNVAKRGDPRPFVGAHAVKSGKAVRVTYSGGGGPPLPREEAERYLAWLDEGGVGKHWQRPTAGRPTVPASRLTIDHTRRVRPSFDLTEGDLAALDSLPPPFPSARNERVESLLGLRYRRETPESLALSLDESPPRGETRPVSFRLAKNLLSRLDAERGPVSRGTFLRAIIDTYKKNGFEP